MGQRGFAVAGAAVGAMFGAPQLGRIAGAAIGGLMFPDKGRTVEGPRLDDLSVSSSAYGQNQKEATVSDAIHALNRALTDALAVDFASGPITLTAAQFRTAIAFKPSATLTAVASLTVPQVKRVFVVTNTDGFFSLDVVRGTNTIAVPPGTAFCLCTDGTANGLYTPEDPIRSVIADVDMRRLGQEPAEGSGAEMQE